MDAQTLRRGFSSISCCLAMMVVVVLLLLIAHVADADVIQARMDENSANKLFFISKFCYSTTGATYPTSLVQSSLIKTKKITNKE